MKVVALAGGVGAAKFLRGLVRATDPEDLTIIVNTGDDDIIHGLYICPDLDTIIYSLSGIQGPQGWGIADDSYVVLEQLRTLGVDAWFTLGDRDLATHLARTTWLNEGLPLHSVIERLARAQGVTSSVMPMTDDTVRTSLKLTDGQDRSFQEYFVKYRHSEEVASIEIDGADTSVPPPGALEAIEEAEAIILCPSNPVISIGPILAVPGYRESLTRHRSKVIAISPIVEGAALKGPAAELMPLVDAQPSASGVASIYKEIVGTFVFDSRDEHESQAVESLGMTAITTDTVMTDVSVATQLAKEVISHA